MRYYTIQKCLKKNVVMLDFVILDINLALSNFDLDIDLEELQNQNFVVSFLELVTKSTFFIF